MRQIILIAILMGSLGVPGAALAADPDSADKHPHRPNIYFFFVDDWGRYAGVYADPNRPSPNDILKTPNIDRVAREGVVLDHAFVPVSSCSPCRAALTTGRYFWNCGSGAFLNGQASNWRGHENPYPAMIKFPDLLRESGYFVRTSGKTLACKQSPLTPAEKALPHAEYQRYGLYVSEAKDPAERAQRIDVTLRQPRDEIRRVLNGRPAGQPFFFAYGTINVHRPYRADSGKNLWGIDPEQLKGRLPAFLPDVADVRCDFADYLGEVQAADAMLGVMLDELQAAGEADNTLVILSGDNGIPGIPRGKTNCYDLSVRAPLVVRWPRGIAAGRRVEDFVSVMDIGPTLLELAGVSVPAAMDGSSFRQQLASSKNGWIDRARDHVIVGRELHYYSARDGNLPYPMRAIRTTDYLYIQNFKPDRWPNGAPYNIDDLAMAADYERLGDGPYRDLDSSLTKTWLLTHRDEPQARKLLDLTLGKRPPAELYDLRRDPDQMHNLADDPALSDVKQQLAARLMAVLEKTHDPRLTDAFDRPPYVDPAVDNEDKKQRRGKRKNGKQAAQTAQ